MKTRTEFPRAIRLIEHVEIPLSDGVRLSAMIWLPKDAEQRPVPAILEYLPYRKRDGTTERDALNHPYFAGHGYAAIRVDMRGAGDSEGVLRGEYLKQEQDDALEVLAWIAAQSWCTGSIGMIGISWGGFNGLQIAARRPPELKAVISLCSTDDRYADDVHFMGGCLLVDKFAWGSTMFSINATPPDPLLVGDRWRDLWLGRLNESGFWLEEWHRRQRRDDLYKHGSICEDYGAIQCPVYLVGGWMDGYSNPIFRMMEHLTCPKKALIGPWAHKYPNFAEPGPRIGFLQESLRWWDKWLKGIETGILDEPPLRAWIQDPVPPRTHYAERPGRWVAEACWPIAEAKPLTLTLGDGVLADRAGGPELRLSICSPQTIGLAAGKWCPYGVEADEPGDQREEAGGSLVFDSAPMTEPLELLGAPILHLDVAADRPAAFVAATLSEVLPDGSATRLSYGLLNLTHRDGHVDLKPLEPGTRYQVTIRLNELGQRIGAGNRLRLALSNAYWPIVWPSPEKTTLSVATTLSRLDLPVRRARPEDAQLRPFEPVENAPTLRKTALRQGASEFTITRDLKTEEVEMFRLQDDGLTQIDDFNWTYGVRAERRYRIHPDDPLSAKAETRWRKEYQRGDFHIAIETHTTMSVSATELILTGKLTAHESEAHTFSREWSFRIPRDHL
ncbi:CocE/NonD family hydrolase [Nordella sp. HKS 07]|uniref:CocE/NonD family hydrolase n=1 Tax=Nordella sp. HKS 07 TaxID=2712222 RepID=UPI0013E1B7C9|nr:CocE/NonD family hydrolase [Nordella sp. HKS 07]QIG48488.1 CocE/NonD family hydrolase [Nordella sp. HKS 07]